MSQKKPKNDARGRPQTPKIQQKPTRENQKIPKIDEKSCFFVGSVFHSFFGWPLYSFFVEKKVFWESSAACAGVWEG